MQGYLLPCFVQYECFVEILVLLPLRHVFIRSNLDLGNFFSQFDRDLLTVVSRKICGTTRKFIFHWWK